MRIVIIYFWTLFSFNIFYRFYIVLFSFNFSLLSKDVRYSSHLKMEVHGAGKLHAISSVMQTCQNNLGFNLYIMPPISCVITILKNSLVRSCCHMQAQLSGNYISIVISFLNYTSLPFTVATFLTTYLMAVLQLSRYSVFHSRDTPIQLSLP